MPSFRRSLMVTGSLIAIAGLAACGNSQASPEADGGTFDESVFSPEVFGSLDGTLTWYDMSGGPIAQAKEDTVFKDFTSLTGVPVRGEFAESGLTKFVAASEAGSVPWNLIEVGTGSQFYEARDAGLLAPIDTDVVPVDLLDPAAVDEYGVRVEVNGAVLAWNEDTYGADAPTSVLDIFDTEKYPGKRCLYQYAVSTGLLESALRADGVADDAIYPIDYDRAFAKLDTIKDDIVWYGSGADAVQFLGNGECDMGLIWSGRAYDAIENQDLPLDFTWQDGMTTWAYFAVPAKSESPEIGMAAIAMWILDRQGQIDFVNQTTYVTPITSLSVDDYDASVQPYVATGDNIADTFEEDAEFWAGRSTEVFDLMAQYMMK